MKLLLDENLSRRLVPALQERFPGSSQVALDEDFKDLQTLHGSPPKVVLLRLGNCSNQQVLEALLQSADRVLDLLRQDSVGVVEVA